MTLSIFAADLYAFSDCFDFSFTLASNLSDILSKAIPVRLFTNSKFLFYTTTKVSGISEKRLLIDIAAPREAYSNRDLNNVGHVLSEHNLADGLTK